MGSEKGGKVCNSLSGNSSKFQKRKEKKSMRRIKKSLVATLALTMVLNNATSMVVLAEEPSITVPTAKAIHEKANGATVYYVSSKGNDENEGTSEEAAFATLDKINSIELKAGDQVLLERGNT